MDNPCSGNLQSIEIPPSVVSELRAIVKSIATADSEDDSFGPTYEHALSRIVSLTQIYDSAAVLKTIYAGQLDIFQVLTGEENGFETQQHYLEISSFLSDAAQHVIVISMTKPFNEIINIIH